MFVTLPLFESDKKRKRKLKINFRKFYWSKKKSSIKKNAIGIKWLFRSKYLLESNDSGSLQKNEQNKVPADTTNNELFDRLCNFPRNIYLFQM